MKKMVKVFSLYLRMETLIEQIQNYKQEIEKLTPNGAESLEAYRIRFLGTKGIVKNLFTEMKNVPSDKKKEFGQILNEFKQLAEVKYENWKQQLKISSSSGVVDAYGPEFAGRSATTGKPSSHQPDAKPDH